jgi:hypothetical protein
MSEYVTTEYGLFKSEKWAKNIEANRSSYTREKIASFTALYKFRRVMG